jgi:tryptophan halogenase
MIDFRFMRNLVVLGGGTAGWCAALELQRLFGAQATITVIESPRVNVIGVGEGGILNLPHALTRFGIDEAEFIAATGAVLKLGFEYVGWNTGREDDVFYHLFHVAPNAVDGSLYDGVPVDWAMLVANGVGVQYAESGLPLILGNASQNDVIRARETLGSRLPTSMHFDAHRVAAYLKQVATGRGVRLLTTNVEELCLNSENGHVHGLKMTGEEKPQPVDFLIDASGFARMALKRTYQVPMRSFSQHLLLDRAIPFYMPHPRPNPHLATRSLAMKAGWMWQIPVQERVGCGYVYSSAHLGDEEALQEIEARVGRKIEPSRTISFEAGHFEKVWIGNVMALGLASGFIEPLEATSIGQMLGQLLTFGDLVAGSAYTVPQTSVTTFNERNCIDWGGIRDFLCLHYDVQRSDTPFWRDVTAQSFPETYTALRQCWQRRLPRSQDLQQWRQGNFMHFEATSWISVGQGTGVIPVQAAGADVARLPRDVVSKAYQFLTTVRTRFALDDKR